MGWIGIADHSSARFDASGLGCKFPNHQTFSAQSLMTRGTLMLETLTWPEDRPVVLIEFPCHHPVAGKYSLQLMPKGGVVLVVTQGEETRHATLCHDPDIRSDTLRLSYSWDSAAHWAQLTLEYPDHGLVKSVSLAAPDPVSIGDMRAVIMNPHHRELHADVDFVALSDQVEPVGPMPGLTGCVPVATSGGVTFADKLRRGDLVRTAAGGEVPVLHTVRRTVPARGSFRPVLIRAPYFGLSNNIVLAPQQRLVIGGSEVEYMFGREAVLAPARHLINGLSAHFADCPDLITYHHILLPEHEAILAAGCPVESLYVGRLRRKRDQLERSILAGIKRSLLPEHAKPVWPVLKPFEAVTLAMNRAA